MALLGPYLPVARDQLYEVAYDEAVRALSEQQAAIDNLRARAGVLFRPPQSRPPSWELRLCEAAA